MSQTKRLAALHSPAILDAAPNPRFDHIARLLARAANCTHAICAFMSESGHWRYSSLGTPSDALTSDLTLCCQVLEHNAPLVVPDTSRDRRFREQLSSTHAPNVRFYAGTTVFKADGSLIGVLSAWDDRPHETTHALPDWLSDLGRLLTEALQQGPLQELERKWSESEQRYSTLIRSIPNTLCAITPAGDIASVTEAAVKLTGYSESELLGQPFIELIDEESRQRVREHLQRCLTGEPQHMQVHLRHRAGQRIHGVYEVLPDFASGNLNQLIFAGRDIGEQALVEQRLRESNARIRLTMESGAQSIWDWDMQTNKVVIRGNLLQVLGIRDEEVSQTLEDWVQLVHPDEKVHFIETKKAFLDGKMPHLEQEFRAHSTDGSYRWYLDRGQVVDRNASGMPLRAVGILVDIDDRKRAEQERERDAARLSLAVQAGGVGIFELDLETGKANLDGRMHELLGLTREARRPTIDTIASVIHPDERPQFFHDIDGLKRDDTNEVNLERRVVRDDGSSHHLRVLGKVTVDPDTASRLLIGTCWDVTASRNLEHKLFYQATHDALTGLLNRYEFERRLQQAQLVAQQHEQTYAVCFIDLDRFKLVNDTAGHAAGDVLLRELAQVMARTVEPSDVLARLGGDEFGLLLSGCSVLRAEALAQVLIDALEAYHFQWNNRVYTVSASVGISPLDASSSNIDDVLSEADVACYAAKNAGRNRVLIYSPEQGEAGAHHQQLKIASGIREALAEDRFILHAQPIVATEPGKDTRLHYELLIRMLDGQGLLISPDSFIPAAERYDLMHHIDHWVLREALERRAEELAAIPGLRISINISAQTLNNPQFIDLMERLIADSPLHPDQIHLEITETAAVSSIGSATRIMQRLRNLGCAIVLDDFGSGLSSFNYLKHFPIDYIKIDGSFIRNVRHNALDRAIVGAIRKIARQLGVHTVAEYVEDESVLKAVRELGVDYVQGYGIGRPLPLEQVLEEYSVLQQSV